MPATCRPTKAVAWGLNTIRPCIIQYNEKWFEITQENQSQDLIYSEEKLQIESRHPEINILLITVTGSGHHQNRRYYSLSEIFMLISRPVN